MTELGIQYGNMLVSKAHFERQDAENLRHNVQEEAIGFANARTNARNAEINAMNAETNRLNYAENVTSHRNNEMIEKFKALDMQNYHREQSGIGWANAAVNARNADSNALQAQIGLMNAHTRENELAETRRSHQAQEAEAKRSHTVQESISRQQADASELAARGTFMRGQAAYHTAESNVALNEARIGQIEVQNEYMVAQQDLIGYEKALKVSQTVKNYVGSATDVSSEVRGWVNPIADTSKAGSSEGSYNIIEKGYIYG